MEINIKSDNLVEIVGNISTLEDKTTFVNTVESILPDSPGVLRILFTDVSTINSSVVGYLVKLKNLYKLNVYVSVTDAKLHRLMGVMGLSDCVNVTLIDKN